VISPQNEIFVVGFPTDAFLGQHNSTAISNEIEPRLRFAEQFRSGWGFYNSVEECQDSGLAPHFAVEIAPK